jgi:hypothetical protein
VFTSLHYLGFATEPVNLFITPDGSAIHVGYHSYTATFLDESATDTVNVSAGTTDAYFACADVNGQQYWARFGRSSQHDRTQAVAMFPGGDVVVAGYFDSTATFDGGTPEEQVFYQNNQDGIFVGRYTP